MSPSSRFSLGCESLGQCCPHPACQYFKAGTVGSSHLALINFSFTVEWVVWALQCVSSFLFDIFPAVEGYCCMLIVHEIFTYPSSSFTQPCSRLLFYSLYPLYEVCSYTWKDKLLSFLRQNGSYSLPCLAIAVGVHLCSIFSFDQGSPMIWFPLFRLVPLVPPVL